MLIGCSSWNRKSSRLSNTIRRGSEKLRRSTLVLRRVKRLIRRKMFLLGIQEKRSLKSRLRRSLRRETFWLRR
jgi:hypothetical protein